VGANGRMLAIEIGTRTIRVVEFVPGGDRTTVTRALTAERPGGEPGAAGRVLKTLLSENGFTARRVLVAYSGPVIEHRIYLIPPVAAEIRDELLRGKVAPEVSTPIAEMRVSGEAVGTAQERGIERTEALAVYTPEFEVRRLTFLLVEAGLSPARIASFPLALAALHPEAEKEAAVGFVHAEPGRFTIAVSSAGKLRFAREFTVEPPRQPEARGNTAVPDYGNVEIEGARSPAAAPDPDPEPAPDAVAERVVTELTRSLLYFRQVSRGTSISRLYWSGEAASPEVKGLILARLKLELAPHPAESSASFQGGVAGSPSDYAIPLGLARAGQVPGQANLLPESYQRRRKQRNHLAATAVVWGAFLAVAAATFVGLHDAESRYRDAIAGSDAVTSGQVGAQTDFLRLSELRQQTEAAERQDRTLRTPFTRWRPLLAWLGASTPRDMAFTSLSIDRIAGGYRGALCGVVRGRDPSEAQARLNGFLAALSRRSLGEGVLYAPVEVRPLEAGEGPGVVQEFRLTFTLTREA